MITLQTADNALKSAYLDVVSEQLNLQANPFLAKIKQTTENVWGKDVRQVVQYGINGGVGAGTEDGSLPTSSSNQYQQIAVTLKNLYGTIEISDKAIRASENNSGAFVNLLNAEMEGLIKASTFNLGRMLFGDGTGALADILAVDGNVLTVTSVKNFAEGMIIDVYYEDAPLPYAQGIKVLAIDRINKKITVSGDYSSEAIIEESVAYVQGSKDQEITGLGAIFNTYSDTLYGLNKNENSWLKPYVINGVSEITEMKIQEVIDFLDDNYGSKVDMIICSSGVKRALQEHLSAYRRNIDVMELQGGMKTISFNGIPVVADRFCPKGHMYLLNSKDFALHQLCDWKWLEGEDGRVIKQVANKPVFKATLVKYAELLCSRPCAQGLLMGITEK